MGEPAFYIFSGATDQDALWLETIEGLSNARVRLNQIAAQSPGSYFLFSLQTQAIIAQVETLKEFMISAHGVEEHRLKKELAMTDIKDGIDENYPTHEQIEIRAYELYLKRGEDGHDVEDWLLAEEELKQEQAQAKDDAAPLKGKAAAAGQRGDDSRS